MDKKVVVITGSSGRIGVRLIERLCGSAQTVGLDIVGAIPSRPETEFVYVDLSSDRSVTCAFDRIRYAYGNRIEAIIHLAAFYSFEAEHSPLYEKITVRGTERLLKESEKFEVAQFIFTSTFLVHAPTERGVITTEETPVVPKWAYPASKVRTEQLIAEKCKAPYVILRVAGCYDEQCNCVPISQQIARIDEKQMTSYFFPGNPTHGVPYIHFDDLVDLTLLVMEKKALLPRATTLIVAEEDSITYKELQEEIGLLLHGKKWPMIYMPKVIAKLGAFFMGLIPSERPVFIKPWMVDLADDNYEISMEKARKLLGWAPKRQLRRTLPAIIEDFRSQKAAWYKRHKIPPPSHFKG